MSGYSTAIHFGVERSGAGLRVAGHQKADEEFEIILPPHLEMLDMQAVISGSWQVWGEHDQPAGNPESLHIVVRTSAFDSESIHDRQLIRQLFKAITATAVGRVLNYALITPDDDWSNQFGYAIIGPNGGEVVLVPGLWDTSIKGIRETHDEVVMSR